MTIVYICLCCQRKQARTNKNHSFNERKIALKVTKEPYVSVIIPVKNEGSLLKNTIESLIAVNTTTSFEIIVVDDGSNDNCCEFLINKEFIKLTTTPGVGSAQARNKGVEIALGKYLVFCDAHLSFEDNWMENLLEPLINGEADAVNPGIADSVHIDNIGYGYTWDHKLAPKWNVEKLEPFYTPLLAGGCLAVSREVFNDVGGFEKNFKVWGKEDEEFSLKLWLFGYRCMVQPNIKILHFFRPDNPPFQITWEDLNWNFLRLAYSHFSQERINKCKSLIKYSDPIRIEEELLASGIMEQRNHYMKRRKFDDNWFMEKFEVPF